MIADASIQERDKYAEIWRTIPQYRDFSPGLENVERFMSVMKPTPGSTLIDIGCGEGKAGLEFEKRGLGVTWLDITNAALGSGIRNFIEAPLWGAWGGKWDYGFCCDVLEHIPTEYTMLCIDRILSACTMAWLQISLVPDNFGQAIGEPLHLTVRPFDWWLVRLGTIGRVTDARDLCGNGLYVVTR